MSESPLIPIWDEEGIPEDDTAEPVDAGDDNDSSN